MSLRYDIEECVEDSFVKYLTSIVSQSVKMKVYPAYDSSVIQYPSAVVMAGKAKKIVEDGAWSTSRALDVDIAVIVEAVKIVNDQAQVITGVREQNRDCRNAILTALAIEDTDAGPSDFTSVCQCDSSDQPKGLAAYLTYQRVDGIWIKYAQMQDAERDVEEEKKCLKTIIRVAVIAQPVQIGGYNS